MYHHLSLNCNISPTASSSSPFFSGELCGDCSCSQVAVLLLFQIERAILALISLRKRAAAFSIRRSLSNNNLQEDSIEQQGDDDEGSSIWSNEACLPELLCLLPVVVSCCPSLCLPGMKFLCNILAVL
jgi:hypothetical protein